MKNFSELGIPTIKKGWEGDKIKMSKIFNVEIIIHRFQIEPSKFNTGDRLGLQIELEGTKRVIFTGSLKLMEMIQKVPADGFPFKTKIIEDNDTYYFS